MECFAKYFELGFLNIKDIKPSRKSREIVTSCESGVRALALTPPGVFGDLLARLQTEDRDLGSIRSA